MTNRRIGTLIVDDEPDLRLLVRMAIEARNEGLYVSGEAANGADALEQLAHADPAVVVLDQMMPGMDGIETAGRILETRPGQPIVLFSAFLDDQLRHEAEATGIVACLPKNRMRELPELLFQLATG